MHANKLGRYLAVVKIRNSIKEGRQWLRYEAQGNTFVVPVLLSSQVCPRLRDVDLPRHLQFFLHLARDPKENYQILNPLLQNQIPPPFQLAAATQREERTKW